MKKTMIIIFSSLLLLLSTTIVSAQVTGDDKALERKIDHYLNEGVANGFSGSILIAKEGKIILNKGYGMANKENNNPYTSTTVSTIGSVTKQFTATAILKLESFHKLNRT